MTARPTYPISMAFAAMGDETARSVDYRGKSGALATPYGSTWAGTTRPGTQVGESAAGLGFGIEGC